MAKRKTMRQGSRRMTTGANHTSLTPARRSSGEQTGRKKDQSNSLYYSHKEFQKKQQGGMRLEKVAVNNWRAKQTIIPIKKIYNCFYKQNCLQRTVHLNQSSRKRGWIAPASWPACVNRVTEG
jgi:hypothetical protein